MLIYKYTSAKLSYRAIWLTGRFLDFSFHLEEHFARVVCSFSYVLELLLKVPLIVYKYI